eukprot:2848148-Prymnesium_polylepis.1
MGTGITCSGLPRGLSSPMTCGGSGRPPAARARALKGRCARPVPPAPSDASRSSPSWAALCRSMALWG